MMFAKSPMKPVAATLAAALLLQSGSALAVEAHTDAVAEAEDTTVVEFAIGDDTVSATIPCAQTTSGPPGGEGFQSSVCIDGDQMFVFASAEGEANGAAGPMVPNFDDAYQEIETSRDTVSIESEDVNGRRTMRAVRGPDPDYGIMQAVEMRGDAVVYVIAMSRPGRTAPLGEAEKQRMTDFVNSLEIGE